MSERRKKWVKGLAFGYCILWLLTLLGLSDVDRAFDSEYAQGHISFSTGTNLVDVIRAKDVNLRDPYGLKDPANAKNTPPQFWRCRTTGIPIAPFTIIDEAGAQWAPLAGIGGRRIVFWFFGFTQPIWIQTYWLS